MLDTAARVFANLVYLVPLQVRRFVAREPHEPVLAAGATKARALARDATVTRGVGWIAAKRGVLILTPERLVCGSWEFPLDSIEQATLVRVRSLLIRALILKVATSEGRHYQFGLQYDPAWEEQTAFQLEIEDGRIRYSAFSIATRAVLVLWVAWLLIRWLG